MKIALLGYGKMGKTIEKFLTDTEDDAGKAFAGLDDDGLDLEMESIDDDGAKGDSGGEVADEAPNVRFVNKVLRSRKL